MVRYRSGGVWKQKRGKRGQTLSTDTRVIIGTRESALAMVQAQMTADAVRRANPGLVVELLPLKTTGDKILDRRLDEIGGKGLFVKELDLALREGRSDLSVHSGKDLPMEIPEDLPLIGFSGREDPRDVLVLPEGQTQPDLSKPIGTSSKRRELQLRKLYPHAKVESVRGNLQTRLRKLDEGQYGALVLAAAGMKRMGYEHRISRYFSTDEMIPAACQGILALQGRIGEDYAFLDAFLDSGAQMEAECERTFVKELDGGCSSPIAAHACREGDLLVLRGLYYDEETGEVRTGQAAIPAAGAEECRALGRKLAGDLRRRSM